MMALDALCAAVLPEMVLTIAKKDTAKESWDTIATMRVGNDHMKKAMTQQLRQKFDLTTFNDGETVEDYVLCLRGMVAHLAMLGEEVKDGEIIVKML
jgi:formylmethanofuran dehydrogenase subunit C